MVLSCLQLLPWTFTLLLLNPLRLFVMSLALRLVGVEKHEVGEWALAQAEREWFFDLLRATRDLIAAWRSPRD